MTQLKTLWAGIAIGLGVAVLAGVIGLFATGTVPTPDIARLLATATHTPTLTPAPTPTLSAEALCRAATTVWVRGMNDIVLMMLDTDETKPKESGQTYRLVQQRFSDLRVPDCADSQLRSIDTSMRAALRSAIAWTDAELEEDLFAAQEAEAKSDALFVVDDYRAYLEANAYTSELQQFRTQSNSVATKTAGYPTRTPVSALKKYQACTSAMFLFRSEIDGYYAAAKSHIETLEGYVQGSRLIGFTADHIGGGSSFSKTIKAPTCINEPTEILYQLDLMFATLKPAYVEVSVESSKGRPSAQSYARVRGWLKELYAYRKEIERQYRLMPKSLAKMYEQVERVEGTPVAIADESTDDRPLNEYALQRTDFPNGMLSVNSRFLTNNQVANSWSDPITALANFTRLGRLNSFEHSFQRSKKTSAYDMGTDYITVGITRTRNAEQASALIDFLVDSNAEYSKYEITVQNVERSVGITHTEFCVEEGNFAYCNIVHVYIQKGNIIGQLVATGYTTRVDREKFAVYAQLFADKLNK